VKLSRTGLELIKKFEGLRLTSYICPAGVWTIGYGHTGPDVYSGLKISEDRAEQLLWQDIESFEQCINSFVNVKLNQNEYDALVSFTYNIGTTAFVNSTLLRLLNEGTDRKVVAEEFKRWVKGGDGEAIPGLVRRREEEKRLFLAKVKHQLLSKSILAKQDTWLKKRMADSTLLAPEEKLFVPKGSAWEWSELTMYAGQRHQAVKLLADQKTWFIWPDHWKIINDVPDDAHTYNKSSEIKLDVPYYSQRDNYRDADRTCFSSTCAMLISALNQERSRTTMSMFEQFSRSATRPNPGRNWLRLRSTGSKRSFARTATGVTLKSCLTLVAVFPLAFFTTAQSAPRQAEDIGCSASVLVQMGNDYGYTTHGENSMLLVAGTLKPMASTSSIQRKTLAPAGWLRDQELDGLCALLSGRA